MARSRVQGCGGCSSGPRGRSPWNDSCTHRRPPRSPTRCSWAWSSRSSGCPRTEATWARSPCACVRCAGDTAGPGSAAASPGRSWTTRREVTRPSNAICCCRFGPRRARPPGSACRAARGSRSPRWRPVSGRCSPTRSASAFRCSSRVLAHPPVITQLPATMVLDARRRDADLALEPTILVDGHPLPAGRYGLLGDPVHGIYLTGVVQRAARSRVDAGPVGRAAHPGATAPPLRRRPDRDSGRRRRALSDRFPARGAAPSGRRQHGRLRRAARSR